MPISVTPAYSEISRSLPAGYLEMARLTVTGLAQNSDNTIAHGLPRAPKFYAIRAQETGGWEEANGAAPVVADATNFYIHSDAGGPTAFVIDALY